MIERGRKAPDGFYDRPDVELHLIWLWNAFWELGSERQLGMSVGPIPGSKIRDYLHDIDLDDADHERARTIIRKADNAYLNMLRSKTGETKLTDQAKASDVEGVKRVLRGLGKAKSGTKK